MSPVTAKKDDKAVLPIYKTEKTFYLPFISNKTELISFKNRYVVRVAKHLK